MASDTHQQAFHSMFIGAFLLSFAVLAPSLAGCGNGAKDASDSTYAVTPSAGANGSVSPNTVQEVAEGDSITFTATPSSGYGVDQWLVDDAVVQTGGTTYELTNTSADHTVHVTFGTVTLTASVSSLALSVNCQPSSSCATTQNAALTGNPRQITIQNTGTAAASNVTVNTSGLPSGTSITSNTCTGTLSASSSCTMTLTPGAIATSDSNSAACSAGTQPVAGAVTISADGGVSDEVDVYVLNYGCVFQGGFVYAIDDTTSTTGSIEGKVVSLVDQAEPYISTGTQAGAIWSSNGNGATTDDVHFGFILGIDETSTSESPSPAMPAYPMGTPAYAPCLGATDGACNSENIVSYYNFNRISGGSAPTPVSDYAAGLCTQTINEFSDWYLPAICELDAEDTNNSFCPSDTQSMVGSLNFLVGNPYASTPSTSCTPPDGTECLAGGYWSSTEYSIAPNSFAWYEYFSSLGASTQSTAGKDPPYGVRCSRAFTL